jgi:4-amino-4-deoxy-L-arabinose transferase-like glycosyltransferase
MKMKFSISDIKIPLIWLIALNLGLKLLMFCFMYHGQDLAASTKIIDDADERSYHGLACNLVKYKTYAPPSINDYFGPDGPIKNPHVLCMYYDALRLPGYPTFIASIYFITGIKPYLAILFQICLSLLSVLLVYRICMLVSGNYSIASIAGLLYAIDIHSIYVSNLLLTDTLCTLVLLASVYFFIKSLKKPSISYIIVSAVFMGLTCIIRPVTILYPLVILLLLFLFSQQPLASKIKQSVIFILIAYVFTAAWAYRNHKLYDHWSLTIQDGYSLVMWNSSFSEARISNKSVDDIREDFQKKADSMGFQQMSNPFDRSDVYKKIGYNYFERHKISMIVGNMAGCIHLFMSIGNIDMAKSFGWNTPDIRGYPKMNIKRVIQNFIGSRAALLAFLILLLLIVEYFGAIVGMAHLWRTKNYMLLLLCVLTIGYFTWLTGILAMYRYKLPFMPFLCILGAYGYYTLLNIKHGVKELPKIS